MLRRSFSLVLLVVLTVSLSFAQRPAGNTGGNNTGGGNAGGGGRPTGGGGGSRPNFPTTGDLGRPEVPRAADVEVRVVYPNERPAPAHIMVQLLANTGVQVGQTFTNSEGQATFPNIPPGTYQIKVSSMDFEDTTSENFVVERYDSRHMEWVHVKPKENAGGTAVGSTQGTVSALDLQAPAKAKKELNKGNESFLSGDIKKAIEHYQKAAKEYPQYATAYNNLGAAYMKLEDRANARDAFTKAAEADPNMPSASANLARIYILDKQAGQAIPLLTRALSGAPNDPEFLMLMARAQLEARNFDEAVTYARKAHQQPHPKYPFVHLIAGQALQAQNKPDEARAEYEIFIKEAPDAPQAAQVRDVIGRLAASAQRPK